MSFLDTMREILQTEGLITQDREKTCPSSPAVPSQGMAAGASPIPDPPICPGWLIACRVGDLVQVHHQDGRVEAGEVQGLTRIEAPSVCRPGYWYWVLSETGEQWVHESLLELGHTSKPQGTVGEGQSQCWLKY